MFTIGSREPSARGIAALVGIVALMWIYNAVAGSIATNLLFTTLLATLPWGLGRLLAARQRSIADYRELSERVDAERDKRAHTAIVGERLRIARELHDVVGHSLSVMIVQSGGARRVLAADPTRATAMLSAVERIGHETLDELRRMLGVLGATDEPAALSPQPGLADVGKAVERARAAGLRAELRIVGDPVPLSPGLDLSAYRIVQEALTNAIKHAGPTRATVTVRWTDARLELDIVDEGNGARSSPAGDGNGLIGMHERVGLFGGRLDAGPLPTRGFAVHAALPIEPAESVT
jgi:signal transduction histidine kinase